MQKVLLSLVMALFLSNISSVLLAQQHDHQWLNQEIEKSVKSGSTLVLQQGKTYFIDAGAIKTVTLNKNASLSIDGNGSTIVFRVNKKKGKVYLFNVKTTDNSNSTFSVKNLKVKGEGSNQQFNERNIANVSIAIPFSTDGVHTVNFENFDLSDIYGRGIQALKFAIFQANNLKFNRVGGKWYAGDENDSFGDAIYFGWNRTNASAKISNSTFVGYPEAPNYGGFGKYNLSRSGVVAEFNTKNSLNLQLTNSSFEGYHRTVHIENSNTSLVMEDITVRRFGCGVFVYGLQTKSVKAINCKFYDNYSDAAFGSALGMFASYESKCEATVENNFLENDVYWRKSEMKVTYKNSRFKFDKYSNDNKNSNFLSCSFVTNAKLPVAFGKMDAQSRMQTGTKSNVIVDILDAIFKK